MDYGATRRKPKEKKEGGGKGEEDSSFPKPNWSWSPPLHFGLRPRGSLEPQGRWSKEEVDSHPNSVWGKESTPSFPPPSFLFFLWCFSTCGAMALLGWPHQPTKGWCATLGSLGSLPGGWAPPGEYPEPTRHSLYTIGNVRNLSGDQMKPSYISIVISGPFRKPL